MSAGVVRRCDANDREFQLFLGPSLARHIGGDWGGDLCDEDKQLNEDAISCGDRVFPKYLLDPNAQNSTAVYIITEADRSATTVLSPEEY